MLPGPARIVRYGVRCKTVTLRCWKGARNRTLASLNLAHVCSDADVPSADETAKRALLR